MKAIATGILLACLMTNLAVPEAAADPVTDTATFVTGEIRHVRDCVDVDTTTVPPGISVNPDC